VEIFRCFALEARINQQTFQTVTTAMGETLQLLKPSKSYARKDIIVLLERNSNAHQDPMGPLQVSPMQAVQESALPVSIVLKHPHPYTKCYVVTSVSSVLWEAHNLKQCNWDITQLERVLTCEIASNFARKGIIVMELG